MTDIILSLRSTTGHLAPMPLKTQRQVHVHSTEIDESGLHVLRATCYSCETVGLGGLNASNEHQSWLFATSYMQQTNTGDPDLSMTLHTDYGKSQLFSDLLNTYATSIQGSDWSI